MPLLVVLAAAQAMVVLDCSIVNVALPSIQRQFQLTLGLVAGVARVARVLAAKTPADPLASAAFMPALPLIIVFRVWAGYELWKGEPRPASARRT